MTTAHPTEPILVTGAAGCIGAWVVANLVRRGVETVVLDRSTDRRRLRLLLDADEADAVRWIAGDIGNQETVDRALAETGAAAIIHLAALQVPFCKADPVAGARVNVLGQVNVFEAARRHGVRRLVYASSVAALAPEGAAHPATLYGVYKAADEGIAHIYAQDWDVPSIGLRPHTVYGPGRDQGLTSAPTIAMLRAAAGLPYTIPFGGALLFQYAGEVAEIFVRCCLDLEPETGRSEVFDLAGTSVTVEEIIAAIRRVVPAAEIAIGGPALPFPAARNDGPLRALLGAWPETGLEDGVAQTIARFRSLLGRGLVQAEPT